MCFLLGILLKDTSVLQTSKTSAFIEVLTLSDNLLIKHISLTAAGCYLPSLFLWELFKYRVSILTWVLLSK